MKLSNHCNSASSSRQDGKSTEERMGRLQLSAVECNYQEIDRQLTEQFIHGLNDTDMLGEIIRELTKVKIGSGITSEICIDMG